MRFPEFLSREGQCQAAFINAGIAVGKSIPAIRDMSKKAAVANGTCSALTKRS
jgi:hypothetical protein